MEALREAARVAAICDKIKEHGDTGKPMSVRKVAVISAMIDHIAGSDGAEGMSVPTEGGGRKARKGSARWSDEVSRLSESKPGAVVKCLRPGCGGDDVSGILREACFMAASRGHPSIIGYRGITLTPGSKDEYSLVADDVGPSLADVILDRGRPFPEAHVRRVMRQLLGAAEAIGERGIVHRDINPANIFFDDDTTTGVVKIANFSAAKSMAEKEGPPAVFAGTNGYTAPEVLLRNADHDAAVDAWSLGCVMMELLVGGNGNKPLLFKGEDEADQLYRIFDVLGVPSRKAMLALKPRVVDDKEVERRRARQRRVGHRNQLRELFPELVLSQDGFDVLNGLLTCDPTKRLTAAAALRCPWFADVDDKDASVLSDVVSRAAGTVARSCVVVLRVAVQFARRAIGLLISPKAVM
ncbi:hypothetical protein PR202_gb07429 [Eleusine coracana subsp. coracana]|uniref:Protein kinase domain-containing protein n=1 Tax=Eleusine coracana subsp. coracana TaxID=191504 RepID=A0AAV5ED14_ELECO|nr:hypothetical protein QOZ80_2BG0170160 [Eleusine coracana subsp. coracana]GJN20101.1 hypothetical protein PR202_gb07429 [Eleusine coracana subsp. coracana]